MLTILTCRNKNFHLAGIFIIMLTIILLFVSFSTAFPSKAIHDRQLISYGLGEITLGDLNGDMHLDIVAVDIIREYVRIYYWPFGEGPDLSLSIPSPTKAIIEDLDYDFDEDLLVLGGALTHIFLQEQGKLSQTPQAVLDSTSTIDIAAGDLNADFKGDIAILTLDSLKIWYQGSDGGFNSVADVQIPAERFANVRIKDLNGDHEADIALASPYEVRIYYQRNGLLDLNYTHFLWNVHGNPISLFLEDFNSDYFVDIAISQADYVKKRGEVKFFLQQGPGNFLPSPSLISGEFTERMALGDLNDDNKVDIAIITFDGDVSIYYQRGMGTYSTGGEDALLLGGNNGAEEFIAIGDLDGDSFDDVLLRTSSLLLYYQENSMPYMIQPIPSTSYFNENSFGDNLIDLRNYFRDDHSNLTFYVEYEENPYYLHAEVDGAYLDFSAKANWYGSMKFNVSAWDGAPYHEKVYSNTFSVGVNDVPEIVSDPPTELNIGEEYLYLVKAEDNYPQDDFLSFALLKGPEGMSIDKTTGLVKWDPLDRNGSYEVTIIVKDAYGGISDPQSFTISVYPKEGLSPAVTYSVATTAIVATVLASFILANENAKYSFLLFFLPLYTKIRRERILDHFVRGKIYGYILANPGEHYNAIKQALSLTNGSLAHHLRTLEREEFIKSKRFGLYRRFYPRHMKIPDDGYFTMNAIQRTIVEIIRKNQGISQKEIAAQLNITPPTVNYHIGILTDAKIVRVIRKGRKTQCFVEE